MTSPEIKLEVPHLQYRCEIEASHEVASHQKRAHAHRSDIHVKEMNPFKDWKESFEKEIRAILAETNMSESTVPSTEEEPSSCTGKPEDRIVDALQDRLEALLPPPTHDRRLETEPALVAVDEGESRPFLCSEVTRADFPDVSIDRDCMSGESVGHASDQSIMEALISDLIRYAPADVEAALA